MMHAKPEKNNEKSLLREWSNHINPDGEQGGVVHSSAIIERGAWIDRAGIVMGGVTIFADERVGNGEIRVTTRRLDI